METETPFEPVPRAKGEVPPEEQASWAGRPPTSSEKGLTLFPTATLVPPPPPWFRI